MGRSKPRRPQPHRPSPLSKEVSHNINPDSNSMSPPSASKTKGASSVNCRELALPLTPSRNPDMGLVRDVQFWKRFSVAIHQADGEEWKDLEAGRPGDGEKEGQSIVGERARSRTGTGSSKGSGRTIVDEKDEWLYQQYRDRRRCRLIGMGVTLLLAILIAAAVVVALYFEGKIKF